MSWVVEIGDEFEPEFDALHEEVQTEILALSRLLQRFGPQLGRPRVDTLKGSRHAHMKELRFSWEGEVWRVAFAFDPNRQANLAGLLPWLGTMTMREGRATAYVCRDFACQAPVTDRDALIEQLASWGRPVGRPVR